MVKIAICDDLVADRKHTLEIIKGYLFKKYIDATFVEFEDGIDLVDEYENKRSTFDIVFLDIFMKHSHGVEVAKKIRKYDTNVIIIFTTTSSDFAVSGYDVDAKGYLLKPLDIEKTEKLLAKIEDSLKEVGDKTLTISTKTKQIKLFFDEVKYLESDNSSIYIYTKNGESIRIYKKLNDVEDYFPKNCFLRCHQSFIVNLNYVKKASNEFILKTGEVIPIRRQDIKKIRDIYSEFVLKK